MIKRILKRISVFPVIGCLLLACLPSYAFADVVEFTEAAKLGATIVDLYGAANNTSLAYDVVSDGSAFTVIENLYTEYSTSAGDPYTLAAIGAAAAAAGTIAVVYDAITGKGYVQLYQTQYIESLDGFWDYTLSDLGFIRNNDGQFEWSVDTQTGDVTPVQVAFVPGTWGTQPLPVLSSPNTAAMLSSAYYAGRQVDESYPARSNDFYLSSNVSNTYAFYYGTGNINICAVNTNSFTLKELSYRYNDPDYVYNTPSDYSSSRNSSFNVYVASANVGSSMSLLSNAHLPTFATKNEGIQAAKAVIVTGDLSAGSVVCQPEFYVGDPLTVDPVITVPDVAGNPDYAPQPMRINTDIEWLPEWGDPLPDGVSTPQPGVPYPVTDPSILNDVVPEIWSEVVQGTEVSPDTDPDPDPDPDPDDPGPDEVFNPLLPVTLPSFNFSFSGIWHYVREWVSSLGAWFTTLFTIWAKLPYAMVVPVYATAVVVIVLGVYKRFFM